MDKVSPAGSPRLAIGLALLLLILGFIVGYGYGYGVYKSLPTAPPQTPANHWPPLTAGLRASPDDRLLAFTGVYTQSQYASRFLLDLKTGGFSAVESPGGWQDYITQWSNDGRSILFEREKIPRPVDAATAGLYQEKVQPMAPGAGKTGEPERTEPELLTPDGLAPAGEKVTAGFWAPDGKLIVKTRREPKALYRVHDGSVQPIDRADVTYYQNRAILENGHIVYYLVRNVPGQAKQAALYRVQNGQAHQLGGAFSDIAWAYVAENGRWMIVCQKAENGTDWLWTLYRVSPQGVQLVKKATVPGDVITVYWSPDAKRVLGASGQSLWIVDIPSLQVHQLGSQTDWKADDAIWLNHENAVVIAAEGILWKVSVPAGTRQQLWKFPDRYWQ